MLSKHTRAPTVMACINTTTKYMICMSSHTNERTKSRRTALDLLQLAVHYIHGRAREIAPLGIPVHQVPLRDIAQEEQPDTEQHPQR